MVFSNLKSDSFSILQSVGTVKFMAKTCMKFSSIRVMILVSAAIDLEDP